MQNKLNFIIKFFIFFVSINYINALRIFENGGYNDLVNNYRATLENARKDFAAGRNDAGNQSLEAAKNLLFQIRGHAINDVVKIGVRAFLSGADFYPENKIYLSDQEKKSAANFLRESIERHLKTIEAEKKIAPPQSMDEYEKRIKSFNQNMSAASAAAKADRKKDAAAALDSAEDDLNFIDTQARKDIPVSEPLRSFLAVHKFFPQDKIYEGATALNNFNQIMAEKKKQIVDLRNSLAQKPGPAPTPTPRPKPTSIPALYSKRIDELRKSDLGDLEIYVDALEKRLEEEFKKEASKRKIDLETVNEFLKYLESRLKKLEPLTSQEREYIRTEFLDELNIRVAIPTPGPGPSPRPAPEPEVKKTTEERIRNLRESLKKLDKPTEKTLNDLINETEKDLPNEDTQITLDRLKILEDAVRLPVNIDFYVNQFKKITQLKDKIRIMLAQIERIKEYKIAVTYKKYESLINSIASKLNNYLKMKSSTIPEKEISRIEELLDLLSDITVGGKLSTIVITNKIETLKKELGL